MYAGQQDAGHRLSGTVAVTPSRGCSLERTRPLAPATRVADHARPLSPGQRTTPVPTSHFSNPPSTTYLHAPPRLNTPPSPSWPTPSPQPSAPSQSPPGVTDSLTQLVECQIPMRNTARREHPAELRYFDSLGAKRGRPFRLGRGRTRAGAFWECFCRGSAVERVGRGRRMFAGGVDGGRGGGGGV